MSEQDLKQIVHDAVCFVATIGKLLFFALAFPLDVQKDIKISTCPVGHDALYFTFGYCCDVCLLFLSASFFCTLSD